MTKKSTNFGWIFLRALAILTLIYTLLPLFILVPFAFNSATYLSFPPAGFSLKWFQSFFSELSWTNALNKSFQVAIMTTFFSVICGTLAAFAIVRRKVRFGNVVSIFILFPMVGPHIVFAIGIFGIFSKLNITGTTLGLVLAHSLVATPFVYIIVASRLASFDVRLEKAAQSLGASPMTSFLKITVPIIAPSIISGAVFAFLISWDEFIITYFSADADTQTLPLRIFAGIQYGVDVTSAAAAVLVLGALVLSILVYRLARLLRYR